MVHAESGDKLKEAAIQLHSSWGKKYPQLMEYLQPFYVLRPVTGPSTRGDWAIYLPDDLPNQGHNIHNAVEEAFGVMDSVLYRSFCISTRYVRPGQDPLPVRET